MRISCTTSFPASGCAHRVRRRHHNAWALLLGALITVLGFNLIAHPIEGVLRLTVIVAALMMVNRAALRRRDS